MVTANRAMARPTSKQKNNTYLWEGHDRAGRKVKGETTGPNETFVTAALRKKGITVSKLKKQFVLIPPKVKESDIVFLTRQLATMMKAGVPMLQSFDIVARGNANPSVAKLVDNIKEEVEVGSTLANAFRKFPEHFDQLYCNLVAAGEQAGILESILDRLATYNEKTLAIKAKVKSAMIYPAAIVVVAIGVSAILLVFVIPVFKELFTSFGADLPAPTKIALSISDFVIEYWYIMLAIIVGIPITFIKLHKSSINVRRRTDAFLLKAPIFGDIFKKSAIARWTRTLSTMFSAGVPLVESLDSVGGAAGNLVYTEATRKIQSEVATGTSLTVAMQNSDVFPNMVTQMVSIGEESGAIDAMLGKVADFYEAEVDEAVARLSSLMEPLIIVFLGIVVGGLVVAMYMPIFQMGQVV